MILNPNAQPVLQDKTVTPRTSQQTVQKDSGYYGLGTVTVEAYPNKPIEIAIVSIVSGASIVYGSTTITTAGVLNAASGQAITINMPATGATLYVDGEQYTLGSQMVTVTLFDDAIVSMSGTSPYVVEVAQADRIGGKVPTGYIYKAWRAWQLLKAAYPGFGYAWVLICDNTTETKFYFLESTFSFSGYSTSTKTMSATGFYLATYTKSNGTWATSHVASGGTATSIDLTDAVYTDVTFTSSGARVFPVAQGTSGVDVSDTTATASDVLAGKYFYTAAGVKTEGAVGAGTVTPGVQKNIYNHTATVVCTVETTAGMIRAMSLESGPTYISAADLVSGTKEISANGTSDVTNYAAVNVSISLPTLNAPTISLSGDTLTITNPATNGNFATGYKVYSDGSLVATIQTTTLDLSTVITSSGTHSVTAKAYGTGFNDSAASSAVSYTVAAAGYSVTLSSSVSTWGWYAEMVAYSVDGGEEKYLNNETPGSVLASGASTISFDWVSGGGGGGSVTYTMGGQSSTVYIGSETVTLTGDMVITEYGGMCLTGDTLITMEDGTQKRIDAISVGDKVLAYDPDTMKLIADEVTYSDANLNKSCHQYDIWRFADGSELHTVHRHRLYNADRGAMVYMDEWRIGEHAVTLSGARPALVAHETVQETVRHYTIFTQHQNYFANGLLCGNRKTPQIIIGQEGDLA